MFSYSSDQFSDDVYGHSYVVTTYPSGTSVAGSGGGSALLSFVDHALNSSHGVYIVSSAYVGIVQGCFIWGPSISWVLRSGAFGILFVFARGAPPLGR